MPTVCEGKEAIRDGYKLSDLYAKIQERTKALDPKLHPHRTAKDFDTLKGAFIPAKERTEEIDKKLNEAKKKKHSDWELSEWYRYGLVKTFREEREKVT